jgi:hypothetical protein
MQLNETFFAIGMTWFIIGLIGGFIGDRLGCSLQSYLKKSVLAQHFLTFITFYLIITVSQPEVLNPLINLKTSFFIFVFYILFTKMHLTLTIGVSLLLLVIFLLNHTEEHIKQDPSHENKKTAHNLSKYKNILIKLVYILVPLGAIIYFIDKRKEYKHKFNFLTFVLGVQKCKSV